MKIDWDRSEGWVMLFRPGRWSLMFQWPRVSFYRKRVHPSQRNMLPSSKES